MRGGTAMLLVIALGAGTLQPGSPASGAEPTEARSDVAQVSVSVATLWWDPSSPRRVDRDALSAPAAPSSWLRGMTLWQRRDLGGRVESQALLGQPVRIVGEDGPWSQVRLVGQPSPKAAGGYPGWVPSVQLAPGPPLATPFDAVVVKRRAWLRATSDLGERVMRVSYNTRLPIVERTRAAVGVSMPGGEVLWARSRDVRVVESGEPARRATRKRLAREAKRFLGLPYLWGGTSGFGVDCSGLTHTLYAHVGITIPRDAGPQFAEGRKVKRRSRLRRGDLVFFRSSRGVLHHVGIYVGRGRMIHAPRTGQAVQSASLRSGIWAREFAGGRRYL